MMVLKKFIHRLKSEEREIKFSQCLINIEFKSEFMVRKPTFRNLGRKIKQHKRQFVHDLKADAVVKRLELVILRIYPRRIVHSKKYNGPLAAACGRDESGLVGLVLWGEQIDRIRIGDIVRIQSGWCTIRDGELVVSTGLSGQITVIDR